MVPVPVVDHHAGEEVSLEAPLVALVAPFAAAEALPGRPRATLSPSVLVGTQIHLFSHTDWRARLFTAGCAIVSLIPIESPLKSGYKYDAAHSSRFDIVLFVSLLGPPV